MPNPDKTLIEAIATRERSLDANWSRNWLPNPDPVLKKLGRDISVYRDLRTDAAVGGAIRRRRAVVRRMEWRVVKGEAGARAVSRAEDWLKSIDMAAVIDAIGEASLYGYSPIELTWSRAAGALLPTLHNKPPEWFLFGQDGQLRFRSRDNWVEGEVLPARKFLCPTQDGTYLNPYGFPDLSMVFWPVTFRRGGLRAWVKFAEKYGMPWAIGKQPRGTPDSDTTLLLDQLESMIEDAVAVIPDDASIEFLEMKAGSGASDLHEALGRYCRAEIHLALLGSNQSSESDSTRASAEAGLEVADDLRDSDARLVEGAINQCLRWIADLNDGEGAAAPTFELYEEERVDLTQAQRDETLARAGVRFTPEYWTRVYGLQAGDLLATDPVRDDAPAAPQRAYHVATRQGGDAADDLAAQLSDEAGEPVDGLLEQIAAMLDAAASLEEFRALLEAAWPRLDRASLTTLMAQALQVAELSGISAVEGERRA